MDESLKVKRHALVLTGHGANASTKERTKEDEQASSNHITVQEVDGLDSEIELTKAPETLEDGGQATVDKLKELNLGSMQKPRPIYMSVMLTPNEDEEYFKLLS